MAPTDKWTVLEYLSTRSRCLSSRRLLHRKAQTCEALLISNLQVSAVILVFASIDYMRWLRKQNAAKTEHICEHPVCQGLE
jgi:hypothetical protein